MKEIIIDKASSGQRADKFLRRYLPEMGSGFMYKMLRKKNITLNEKKMTGNEMLREGDRIRIFFAEDTLRKFMGDRSGRAEQKNSLPTLQSRHIIYEDPEVLILNKDAGLLSQKSSVDDISLNEYMLSYLTNKGQVTEESLRYYKPGICNRLDRNTSGLVLAGKSLSASQTLNRLLKDRSMDKYYLALVKGIISEEKQIRASLTKNPKTNKVTISEKASGVENEAYIETIYQPLKTFQDEKYCHSLIRVKLVTGRTHQIRSHLAFTGHPLAGDAKYGEKNYNRWISEKYKLKYQFLHAYEVYFPDQEDLPEGIRGRHFRAELPEKLEHILSVMEEHNLNE